MAPHGQLVVVYPEQAVDAIWNELLGDGETGETTEIGSCLEGVGQTKG